MQNINFNDLALYSTWPKKLLDTDACNLPQKTKQEIEREFGNDKWGRLLDVFGNRANFTLEDVYEEEIGLQNELAIFDSVSGFGLTSARNALRLHIELYENILRSHINGASGLVELGAGYGGKILNICRRKGFSSKPVFAAEYTDSGCQLIKKISEVIDIPVRVGKCDFNSLQIEELNIPPGAVFFTSYSVHYTAALSSDIIDFLLGFDPKAIVFFEPCYELYDENQLHGLMCKRYIEINGYTKNIASSVIEGCTKNGLDIKIHDNILGSNPFLPLSIIECIST